MLTSTGRGLVVVAVVAVLAGWALGWPELVGVGVAGAGALGLAAVALRRRPELVVERTLQPSRVTAGDPATGHLVVTNPEGRASATRSAHERVGSGSVEVAVPRLAAGASTSVDYDLPTARRGVLDVGPLVVRRGDPLGLARADQELGGSAQLWVHPRRHVVPPLPSRLLRSLEGPEAETAPQGSITFHTIRDYVRGDDLRHVHWRTTARTGTLMVRQLVDTSFPDVTVVLDDRPGPYPGDAFEPAVEIVASIVVACTRERFPVHLRTPGGVALDSAGDPRAEVRALDVLTQLTPAPGPSLVAVLDRLGRDGQGSAAVLVTGSVDADQLAPLALLRRRFPVVVAVLVRPDAEGDAVPSVPGVTVLSVADSTAFAARWRTKAAR